MSIPNARVVLYAPRFLNRLREARSPHSTFPGIRAMSYSRWNLPAG